MYEFDLINSALRAIVTLMLAYKLVAYYKSFNFAERIGMAQIASGSFLTIPPIWAIRPGQGVFDGWSTAVMTFGVVLYFAGRLWRNYDHRRRNIMQAEYYDAYFADRDLPR